jgi:HD-like signal output (HDOD) protein
MDKPVMNEQMELKGSVLFYDVDPEMIAPLKQWFQEEGITLFSTDDPSQGIRLIQKEKIDIVLVDYQPGRNDVIEFLKILKKKLPFANRIALSNTQHRGDIIGFLLKGIITSYFETSGGLESLPNSILHILFARKTLKNQKLVKLLKSAEILPTFPKTYNEFVEAIENNKSMKEVARIIEKDVSIATRVLRIANSDFFRTSRIGSIERAGIYLGLDTIKNIVFTVSLSSLKRLTSNQKKHLEKVIYHSVQVNQNFQKLYSTKTGNKITDQFATIGITHDIGKIIMLQYLPQRFNKIVKYQQKNPDISFYRSEVELGFEGQTHAEIGAYFLNLWNFPEASVFTALFHHSTEEFSEPYKEILDIFAIVNELANKGDGG